MKKRAFIVKLEIDDSLDPLAVAEDIHAAVYEEGYNVQSVAPWNAPTELEAQAKSITNIAQGLPAQGLGILPEQTND
jgi:hypothetical protein